MQWGWGDSKGEEGKRYTVTGWEKSVSLSADSFLKFTPSACFNLYCFLFFSVYLFLFISFFNFFLFISRSFFLGLFRCLHSLSSAASNVLSATDKQGVKKTSSLTTTKKHQKANRARKGTRDSVSPQAFAILSVSQLQSPLFLVFLSSSTAGMFSSFFLHSLQPYFVLIFLFICYSLFSLYIPLY